MNTISEQYLDEARQYRGSGDERAWEMADWVKSVLVRVDEERHGLRSGDRTRIFKELAIAMGVSRASVSDLCQLAETYEPARKITDPKTGEVVDVIPGIREQFADVLTIGHYREAMRCKTIDPLRLLHEAVETADEWNGQPMPVDALRVRVREANRGEEPKQTKRELFVAYIERMCKALDGALDYCEDETEKRSLTSMREWLSRVTE